MSFDILIVGAGLSGAVIAHELALSGKKILLLEKRDVVAGNVYDKRIENINVHCYGPHIFHTNNDEVYKYMSQFWELNNFSNKVEAQVKNNLIPVPFNFAGIDLFFPNEKDKLKEELIKEFGKGSRVSIFELLNSKNESINKVAKFVYENVFLNYTTKMWGLKPNQLGDDVMKRVPVVLSYDDKYFHDKYEGVPKQGYTTAIKKMLDHPNIEVKTNIDASSLLKLEDGVIYYEGKPIDKKIIYSGPIDELMKFKFGELPYRSLFIDFKTIDKESYQKTAVVNYPNEKKITRITEYKKMTFDISKKTIISVETPGAYDKNSKLFSTPYYPLTTEFGKSKHNLYLEELKKYPNLIPIGRLATFKYINMDQAVLLALNCAKELKKSVKNG